MAKMSIRRLAINWLGVLGALSAAGIIALSLLGYTEVRFLGYGLVATVSALAALTPPKVVEIGIPRPTPDP